MLSPTVFAPVSNISTNNNVNTTTSISHEKISSNPTNLNATSLTDGGKLKILNPSGTIVTPNGIPIIVVAIIPNSIAPFTFFANKNPVIIIPNNATNTGAETTFPSATIVPFPWITTPAPLSPINAINNPIPTETACFKFIGIESKIASLAFTNDNNINITPSINTAVNANCQ